MTIRDEQDSCVNLEEITLTKGDPKTDLGLDGFVNADPDYSFCAKVFDVGSSFGIDGGRISKLTVRHDGEEVMHYSRGWCEEPQSQEHRDILQRIVSGFPEPQNAVSVEDGIPAPDRGKGRSR